MTDLIKMNDIQSQIFTLRGKQVMLDRDLADLYNVEVKRLNEQVKRNIKRFPIEFRFQLNDAEKNELVANCDRFENLKYSSVNPYAFTEQGVSMLSAVLRSETAIKVSIKIINAFVEMRNFISANANIFQRLEKVEIKLVESDTKFEQIFKALGNKTIEQKQGVFYNGQIFDSYVLISKLIKSAKKSILLIDNYIDETVLNLFSKRRKNVEVKIYTKNITKTLKQDLEKFNSQYEEIKLVKFNDAHGRFLIIDNDTIYHFGASLKDLGKKWFAFSKIENKTIEMLSKLKG